MNLMDLFIKIGVDDQASGKMEEISSGMIAKGQLIADAISSAVQFAGEQRSDSRNILRRRTGIHSRNTCTC